MDSPAQGWGHSHHRHLLTRASSPKTPDQATLTGHMELCVPLKGQMSLGDVGENLLSITFYINLISALGFIL